VREYCDKAILINEGVITHAGPAEKVADEYLKLFNGGAKNEDAFAEGDRWGNGSARFTSVDAKVAGERVHLKMVIEAKDKALDDVVVGFRIKDSEGVSIAGANSIQVKGGERFSLAANEKKTLHFDMQNIFGGGTFFVGATIRLSDKVTICEDWTDATSFRNTREDSHYPIVSPAELTID